MSRGYSVPVLHQQDGGLSLQAFAEREGLTAGQVKRCIRAGKVLGAQQDSRSKHWWIYPPAKLLERPRSHQPRGAAAGFDVAGGSHTPDEVAAQRLPVHPTEAQAGARSGVVLAGMGIPEGGRCTPTTEGKAEGILPSAKPVLGSAALPSPACGKTPPTGASPANGGGEFSTCHRTGKPDVYTCPETQSVLAAIREAAARQHREGIHYLRLDGGEFAQLYAALGHERSRIRKLVSRGLAAIGELRISDSVWQKLQAMCHEGKLL